MSCDARNEDDMREKARLLSLSHQVCQVSRLSDGFSHVPAAILIIFGTCPLKIACLFLSVDSQ